MGMATVHTETLRRAAALVGGEAGMARAFDVPCEQARRWLSGEEYPPTEIYHKALDLLIGVGSR